MKSETANKARLDKWLLWQTAGLHPSVLPGARLEVNVIYTTPTETLEGLKMAAQLAGNLEAEVNLLATQAVPFELELTRPPVSIDCLRERYTALAARAETSVNVQVIFCRDKVTAYRRVLKPGSLIVVGGRKGSWPTWRKKLIARLKEDGHHVILSRGW